MNDDKIKELLDFGFAVEGLVRQLAAGVGILQIPGDIIKAISVFGQGKSVLADAPAALEQYMAMDDATAQDIESYVVAHYGVNPDTVDKAVEVVLNIVVWLHELVAHLKQP